MQIIIPMSGFGERFRRRGYSVPKPLIEIEKKSIIAHVMDLFPGESNFIFICNQEHLDNPDYKMRKILEELCPTGRIIGIPPHKLGPVYAVLQVAQYINPDEPTIVNYCDFTCYWNWPHFKNWLLESQCDGAVPAYKGFHPHSLGTVNYAYMREQNGWMLDIQEKQPFTDNRMNEFASSGTYYFSSGQLMLEAFKHTMDQNLHINGEFYVSLAYKALLELKKSIAIYELQHFMQWGTPEDVTEYNQWSTIFDCLSKNEKKSQTGGVVIIPMAGLGERFSREGYVIPKPLIDVSGKPMVVQATSHLPLADHYVFVLRADMPGVNDITNTLSQSFSSVLIEQVPAVTEGQACSALKGLNSFFEQSGKNKEVYGPITFGACDNGVLWDEDKFQQLLADNETDIIVWVARGHAHAIRHPHMYGWVLTEGECIKSISVKVPLSSPESDPIVLGTFTFKRAGDFYRCMEHMMKRNARVNGEFYLDTCINDALALGLNCKIFEVDHYISWGTPNDLRTFEYWQSCFHKWSGHLYQIELDKRIPEAQRETIASRYQSIHPNILEKLN